MADTNVSHVSELVRMSSEKESTILKAVIGILSIFSVLGAVGNFMVLNIYTRKRNKKASTIFIITLASTDFLTCIVIIPYTVVFEYMAHYVKYDFFCKFYMLLITSNVPFSALIMAAIAVDRYLGVCHPFKRILTAYLAKWVVFCLAMIALTLGIITSLNYGVVNSETKAHSSSINSEDDIPMYFGVLNGTSKDAHHNTTDSYNDAIANLQNVLNSNYAREMESDGSGVCRPSDLIFSESFTTIYQQIYSSFFLLALIIVVVMYTMIVRFITLRHARRQRMRMQENMCSRCKELNSSHAQTRASIVYNCVHTEVELTYFKTECFNLKKSVVCQKVSMGKKALVANIRTAGMLCSVTAVFIIVFLPAWLMAHRVISYNMLVFYMYFFYNVANPILYAFMNKAFRRDLKRVLACR